MKHAIIAASDEPAAKRRKVERQPSVRSHRSADSGYNSDDSSHRKMDDEPANNLPASITRRPSGTLPASPSNHSHGEEEDFTEVIARARARLYSNASLSLPSPPASHASFSRNQDSPANSNAPPSPVQPQQYEEYHSPVSVEPITAAVHNSGDESTISTSGCNLGTFISLGLAVTSYERNLLSTLVPEPQALPSWQMEAGMAKRMDMLEARRRLREQEQARRKKAHEQQKQLQRDRQSSYAGFAISCHDDDDEGEAAERHEQSQRTVEDVAGPLGSTGEEIDDFFNMDAACEEDKGRDCVVTRRV